MNPSLVSQNFSVEPLIARLCALATASNLWAPRTYAKNGILFDQDNAPTDVFVLTQGFIKLLYITPEGDEKIKSFIPDQGLFAVENDALAFGARAVETSTVARLPPEWVRDQLLRDAGLQRAYGDFTNWVRQRKALREQSLLCETPSERLQIMRKLEPGLIDRLPQGDVARYLGITPIAFSRIKRRLDGAII